MTLDGYVCSVVKDMDSSQMIKYAVDVNTREYQSLRGLGNEKHKTPTRERPE